jgi:potassium-dependent mechanosensitive channel
MKVMKHQPKTPAARLRLYALLLIALGLSCLLAPVAGAQEPAAAPEAPPMTIEQAQARLADAEQSTEFEEAVRNELVARWTEVVEVLRRGAEAAAQAARYEELIQQIPGRIEELQAVLEQTPPDPLADLPEDLSLTELEQTLARYETTLEQARVQKAELEAEPARRDSRRAELARDLAQARVRLEEVRAQTRAAVEPGPLVGEAVRTLLAARQWALGQEIAAYERELRFYDAAGQLLTLRIRNRVREESQAQRAVTQLQEIVLQRRQLEARQAATQAREAKDLIAELPYLRDAAEELRAANEAMARRRTGLDGIIAKLVTTQEAARVMRARVARVMNDFTSVDERIRAAGLNNAVGMLLRTYRAELPRLNVHRSAINAREETIADVQLELIQLREEQSALADIEAALADIVAAVPPAADDDDRAHVESIFRDLLRNKQQNLDNLIDDLNDYYQELQRLDAAERELVRETQNFAAYIDERVLWIASGPPFGLSQLRGSWDALQWLGAPANWRQAAAAIVISLRQHILLYVILLLVGVGIIGARRRMGTALIEIAGRASKRSTTSLRPSLEATALTLLLAIPAPLMVGAVGWLVADAARSEFATGLGAALQTVAYVLLLLGLVQQLIRRDGLAEAHFGWPEAATSPLRRFLFRLSGIIIPAVFLIKLLEFGDGFQESLGRAVFLVLAIAVAIFFWVTLRPHTGAFQRVLDNRRVDYSRWFRGWWHVLAGALPLLLAVATLAGYFYTVLRLSILLYFTVLLAAAVLVVYGLILRWLMLARRHLAIEQARKRLAALKARDTEGEQPEVPLEDTEVDLVKVDVQTQRLVRSLLILAFLMALWFIWAETLPALNILHQWELGWTTTESVERTVQQNGHTVEVREETEMPVTGVHLLLAIVIAIMTIAATRNLPGLLEIAILQRIAMGAGERYAATTVTRYILATLGIVLVFRAIGIGWSNVQWLVAAVGLGLGFGLQEIFANFVSGIIILFERPIRVGDTVTVGGISGTVTRIRIRATTIMDFDRKELVVPNKEFVTNQIINWTLSTTTLRIVIPVGIAYGSDIKRAEQLMHEVASRHASVMTDPAPEVWFTGFGESSLNFELRVFSPNLDEFLRIRHDMLLHIDQAFRDAGIEIAFPQRDIRVRAIEAVLPVAQQDSASVALEATGEER